MSSDDILSPLDRPSIDYRLPRLTTFFIRTNLPIYSTFVNNIQSYVVRVCRSDIKSRINRIMVFRIGMAEFLALAVANLGDKFGLTNGSNIDIHFLIISVHSTVVVQCRSDTQ